MLFKFKFLIDCFHTSALVAMSEKKDKTAEKTIFGLKREIGLLSAVNFLINVIIGKLSNTVVVSKVLIHRLLI